jgi:hypothetical protein
MRRGALLAAGFGLVASALPPVDAVADARAAQRAEAIVRHAGLEPQLEFLAAQLVDLVVQQAGDLPPESFDRLDLALREHMTGDALRAAVLAAITSRIRARRADATLAWLRSPLGVRVTVLDTQAATPEGQVAIRAHAQTLAQRPPEALRLELAARFRAATGEAQLDLELMMRAMLTVAEVLQVTLPPEQRSDPAALSQRVEVQRSALRPIAEQMTLASFLYRYRELSNTELTRYLQFVESDAGRWFHLATGEALLEAVATTSAQTIAAVAGAGAEEAPVATAVAEAASARTPLAPAGPNFLQANWKDADGTAGFLHVTPDDMPLVVAVGLPKEPPKRGSRREAREAAMEAIRQWEGAIQPRLPWFEVRFVEKDSDAAVQIQWKRRITGPWAGFGRLRYWIEDRTLRVGGEMEVSTRPDDFSQLTVDGVRLLITHEFGHVLGLGHCHACDSAMNYEWDTEKEIWVTDLDVETFVALVAQPNGHRVDGRPFSFLEKTR